MKPLTGGKFYTGPEVKKRKQKHGCIDPYQINKNLPAPQSVDEADRAWARAKARSAAAPPITRQVVRIIARRLEKSDNHIALEADLSQVLQDHGPGIYTVVLWGRPSHLSVNAPISEQSIFWQIPSPPGNPYVYYVQDSSVHSAEALTPATATAAPTTQPQNVVKPTYTPGPTQSAPTLEATTKTPTPPERQVELPVNANTPAPAAHVTSPEPTEDRISRVLAIKTPVPLDTQVPAPTATQRPTSIPTPTATRRPTPTPSPTVTPLPIRETYANQDFGYSIDHPYGWTTKTAGSKTLIQDHAQTGGFIEIHQYPVQKDQSVGDLADAYMESMLRQAPLWTHFDPSWAGGSTNDSGQYLILKFARRKTPNDCKETGEVHIFRSKYVPKRLIGYSLTMATCEDSARRLGLEIGAFLESFKEN